MRKWWNTITLVVGFGWAMLGWVLLLIWVIGTEAVQEAWEWITGKRGRQA